MSTSLSRQDRIWNRAAMDSGGANPSEGDVALAAVLTVHGMVMNGGLDHALDVLTKDQYAAGLKGFRYFGLSEAAAILERAGTAPELDLKRLNAEYGCAVPNDNKLVHAFRQKLLASPSAFSPLDEVRHA